MVRSDQTWTSVHAAWPRHVAWRRCFIWPSGGNETWCMIGGYHVCIRTGGYNNKIERSERLGWACIRSDETTAMNPSTIAFRISWNGHTIRYEAGISGVSVKDTGFSTLEYACLRQLDYCIAHSSQEIRPVIKKTDYHIITANRAYLIVDLDWSRNEIYARCDSKVTGAPVYPLVAHSGPGSAWLGYILRRRLWR